MGILVKIGVVGWVVWLVAILVLTAGFLGMIPIVLFGASAYTVSHLAILVTAGAGLLLASLGCAGMGRMTGGRFYMAAAGVGVVGAAFDFVIVALQLVSSSFYGMGTLLELVSIPALSGTFFLMLGIALVRDKTTGHSITTAAGVFSIIEGALLLSVLGAFFALLIFVPAALLNIVVLARASGMESSPKPAAKQSVNLLGSLMGVGGVVVLVVGALLPAILRSSGCGSSSGTTCGFGHAFGLLFGMISLIGIGIALFVAGVAYYRK
ncbi:hypothetical protein HYS54_04050 [Candidatus Micrarchaeota archaeon]|nr:hypothetical protein [Candidatus Micrarchaeota archaeon]